MSKAYTIERRSLKEKGWGMWFIIGMYPSLDWAQRDLRQLFADYKKEARHKGAVNKWKELMKEASNLPSGQILEYGREQWRISME